MSTLSFADTVFALRFLRLLTMPYEKTAAFKTGVIDKTGLNLINYSDMDQKQRESYTLFHRLVFNIRTLLSKIPMIGKSILTNYAAALLLIKEEMEISNDQVLVDCLSKVIGQTVINEENTAKELRENFIYRLRHDLPHSRTGEMIFKEHTQVIINGHSDKTFYGIRFYKATHIPTNQNLLVCSGDVTPTNTVDLIPPRETKDQLFTPKKKKKKKKHESI
jgi:hypothetical protein